MRLGTAFLDRDGTITAPPPEGRYILTPRELVLLPGAAEAIRLLNAAAVRVVVVTNQRCVALGLLTSAGLDRIHARLADLLAEQGARLDAVYTCPHHEASCDCRKPAPGLLLRAVADIADIDPCRSVMIGDSERDVGAGLAAGVRTIRLGEPGAGSSPVEVYPDLLAAVRACLDPASDL